MMEDRDGEIHMETDEARGGSTPNIVRWVLGVGLLLAIVGMSLAWIIPTVIRKDDRNASVSAQALQQRDQGTSTDSVITPEQANPDAAGAGSATPAEGAVPAVANKPGGQ